MSVWYIIYNGQKIGPMTKENIMAYNPTPETQVWREGMANWQPLYTIPELMEMRKESNAPAAGPNTVYTTPPQPQQYVSKSGKDKTVAGILAIFLGWLGIQYFYCGKAAGGILTIVLCIVTCGLWEILTFIQGIMMLMMSQEEFDRKFVDNDKTMPLF